MSTRLSIVASLAIVGAAGYALLHHEPAPVASTPMAPQAETMSEVPRPAGEALPPGHPPIDGARATPPWLDGTTSPAPTRDEAPAITWNMPATWSSVANPSSLRLATYRVPRASGDTEDAEMSVSRAGGGTDANIERWIGQFDAAGKDTRTERRVHGLKVAVVEVAGTFTGGSMTPGAANTSKPGWALLAAVVETRGTSYFFKLTGPAATVHAARASFTALLDGITPS